jgi:hypothetical protein
MRSIGARVRARAEAAPAASISAITLRRFKSMSISFVALNDSGTRGCSAARNVRRSGFSLGIDSGCKLGAISMGQVYGQTRQGA